MNQRQLSDGPPKIVALPNGPFRVTGVQRIVWQLPVTGADGVPITWRRGDVVCEPDGEVLLCRCGLSATKPFCDDSHLRAGFKSEDDADVGSRSERASEIGGGPVQISEDPPLCAHAGFCGDKVTNVWKLATRDDLDAAGSIQLTAMIQHCPSGTLALLIDGQQVEPSLPTELALIPDGPIWVTGGIEVARSDGQTLERRTRVTLCRCGASANMPLCDGAHEALGFEHSP